MKQKRYKKFKKFLIGIVLISGILCSNQQNAQAKDGYICKHGLHTFGDHTINGGVGNYGYTNRYYWIHNAFSSTYEAYIKLDTSTLNSIPAAQRQATCAHELGHAMGLSHHMISSSIMCQYGDGRNAKRASKNDLKAINHLYK